MESEWDSVESLPVGETAGTNINYEQWVIINPGAE